VTSRDRQLCFALEKHQELGIYSTIQKSECIELFEGLSDVWGDDSTGRSIEHSLMLGLMERTSHRCDNVKRIVA